MKPIPYGRHHITEDDINAVVETLKSDYLTQGPAITAFEKAFAEYIGAKYAVAVNNGTAALHLCTMALHVKPRDKVITTPITFAASANCVKYCGGDVIFADIDPSTFLMDLNKVEEILKTDLKKEIKGLIPVDFAGYPINAEEYRELADKYNLWIIEDACHAPGAYFTDKFGKKQLSGKGIFSDLTVFSFHPVKHIATGEGGMITTNSNELYQRLILLRTHGITKDSSRLKENHGGWYYEMQDLGYNYRITDFQAALGLSQLKRADWGLNRRNEIAHKYDMAFEGTSVITPKVSKDVFHAYHLYVILIENRLELYNYLKNNKIYSQVHYIPVHLQPYYKIFGWKSGDMPVAEKYYEYCLSLPMYPTLTDDEQTFVIEKVIGFFKLQ